MYTCTFPFQTILTKGSIYISLKMQSQIQRKRYKHIQYYSLTVINFFCVYKHLSVYRMLYRAQRQNSSIPAHSGSKLVLVTFHPLSQAKEMFLFRQWLWTQYNQILNFKVLLIVPMCLVLIEVSPFFCFTYILCGPLNMVLFLQSLFGLHVHSCILIG